MTKLSIITNGQNQAVFSPCGRYRYKLTWRWSDAADPSFRAMFVCMLNPSTADASKLDPTITRIVNRAKAGGFGAAIIINLFALRATHPKDLLGHKKPVGDDNDQIIQDVLVQAAKDGSPLLVGWGNHGAHQDRDRVLAQMAVKSQTELVALGANKTGQPKHPLYVRNVTQPEPWVLPEGN